MHMRDGSATSTPVRLGHKLLLSRIPMHGAHMHWGCTSNPGALGVACFSCGAAHTRLCIGLGELWFPGFGAAEPQFRWAPRVQPSSWPDLTSADAAEPFWPPSVEAVQTGVYWGLFSCNCRPPDSRGLNARSSDSPMLCWADSVFPRKRKIVWMEYSQTLETHIHAWVYECVLVYECCVCEFICVHIWMCACTHVCSCG